MSVRDLRERAVYGLLKSVLCDKAYSQIALDKELRKEEYAQHDRAYITNLFYGVLDKSIQFDYIIKKLCSGTVKPAIKILIKMGLYLLRYTDTPEYAAVDKIVELTKSIGKGALAGFVNAVLKNSRTIILPDITDMQSLSINASIPVWIAEETAKDYPYYFIKELFTHKPSTLTHIRHNGFKLERIDFDNKYSKILENPTKTGYYVTHNTIEKLEKGDYIIQSLSSTLAVNAYFEAGAEKILDLCAAPGGKSVYLKQLYHERGQNVQITACDVHEHRVGLINKYAAAAGCELDIRLNDAAEYKAEFDNVFDFVICDVPCSGIGVTGSKPDILLNRECADIENLCALQQKIISNAARYVKKGGTLCYSTCTILKRENDNVIERFLNGNPLFCIVPVNTDVIASGADGFVRLFPHIDGADGFFVAKLRRTE